MRKIGVIALCILLVACDASKTNRINNTDQVTLSIEKDTFDVNSFEYFLSNGGNIDSEGRKYTRYSSVNDTIIEDVRTIVMGKKGSYYKRTVIPPIPGLFVIYRTYDSKGILESEITDIPNGFVDFVYGLNKEVDSTGRIIKVTDNKKDYDNLPFNLTKLIDQLIMKKVIIETFNDLTRERAIGAELFDESENNIDTIREELANSEFRLLEEKVNKKLDKNNYFYLNPYDRIDLQRLGISIDKHKRIWSVEKNLGFGRVLLQYDTQIGKLLEEKYEIYFVEIDNW